MVKNKVIEVQDTMVSVINHNGDDYICITDMARAKSDDARAADVIKNWIRTRTTLEFLGTWEKIYNPNFKVVEFDHFKSQAGLPSFVLQQLNRIAITQMTSLVNNARLKKLK